uniref:DUF4216 domain-containing protein n=1 Tax=Tanacetum cinerariifolium TaxID=118510 RepID=A0A699H9V1_TANCI|nr:hypothetical protein [Tanacetum cinerariifolium]
MRHVFDLVYKIWVHHGEPDLPPAPPAVDNTIQPQMSDMTALLNDLSYIPSNNEHNEPTQGDIGETSNEPTQDTCNEFEELYASANEELYFGCDYATRLDFMEKFTYFKVKGKLTDSIFNEMSEFFQNVFPISKGYKLPPSYYAIKKTFKTNELGYESIHACKHDSCLFRGDDNKDLDFCPVCNTSRWKDSNTPGKKVHKKYPDFAKELRNVRLGLAADGFNPFDNLSQAYSMWPVILTTYNLPLWLCMKVSSFMLTLLIPGPKSPGKDIDVYLRPLIEHLKVLWDQKGVETIDVASGQKLNMRAMVLWTINDFSARSSLSGWSGQGYKACPTCNKDTPSVRVLSKTAYVGHRRFLKKPNKWKSSLEFNGETDNRDPPKEFGRDEILAQLDRLPTRVKGKHPSYGGVKIRRNVHVELNWTKRSIFYELEYWSFLSLRHNLDIMHIEKNVLEAILNTLLMNDRSKDTAKARQYLERLGIRSGLWLGQTKNRKCLKPQAAYSFTPENRKKFCQFIKGVKLPDGFGSCFKHKVTDNDTNITGLKSHDCHIMMQRLLPYGLQQYLPDKIAKPIIELSGRWLPVEKELLATCYVAVSEDNNIGSLFPNKDMTEEFPDWFGSQVSTTSELFALACGPTWTLISINSCLVDGVRYVVHSHDERRTTQNSGICSSGPDEEMYYGQLQEILEFKYLLFKVVSFRVKWFDTQNQGRKVKRLVLRNNMTQIDTRGEAFKNDQYILVTQVKQVFYLEDKAKPLWKVIEHVNHKKFSDGGVIVVEDDLDIIHFDNSSDLPLFTSLNDLDNATLYIDGQSTEVDAPPDIIDVVDEDDDIIDDEDALPHYLVDSDDEDLINVDDDGVDKVYSSKEED